MKVATVTTLKATLEDTLSFVYYHLNSGVDHMYLFFDNPHDRVLPLLSNNPNITCIKCSEQHWQEVGCSKKSHIEIRQTLNADLALRWCKKAKIDWIGHIDVDELVYTEQNNLKSILDSLDINISYLSIQPFEAIPINMDCINPFKEISNFKVLIRNKSELEQLPHKDETLFLGEYFRGHLSGKSFTRISDDIKSLNIHKPSSNTAEALIEAKHKDCLLLHYDCYNFENWLNKWCKRYDGTAKFKGRQNRNKQFMEFTHALESNNTKNLVELYKRMHLISPETIKLLKSRKAVKTINILDRLFKETIKK